MPMPLRLSHTVSIVLGTLLLAMTGAVSAQNYQVTTLATGLDKPGLLLPSIMAPFWSPRRAAAS